MPTDPDDGFQRLSADDGEAARARAVRSTERVSHERPELRPRGVGELLDIGLDALRTRFAACVGVCIVLWLAPAWMMAFLPPEEWGAALGFESQEEQALWALAGIMVNSLTQMVVQVLGSMVVALIVRGEFAGEPLSLGAALGIMLRRFLPILLCIVLITLISIAGMIACILPYFFFLWRLSTAALVCASEELGPAQSLSRSFWLTRGSFLRWLGVTFVSGLLLAPLTMFAGAATTEELREVALENLAIDPTLYRFGLWLAGTLFFGVATAAGGAFTTAYYFDCRVRREALDLHERVAALAAAPRSAP